MTRMTTYIRDKIVENALAKAGYTESRKAWGERRHAFIEAVRLVGIGIAPAELSKIESHIEKLRSQIPEQIRGSGSVLKVCSHLRLNAAGEREWLYFGADGDEKRVSAVEVILPHGHPLVTEREELKAEDARLEDLKERIKGPVRSAIKTVSTVAALLKAWPEAKELLPENLAEAKSNLPALRAEELNALVGLPSA